jgi:cation diffusion facilitator CzcD-associated flavoprotein CzcO
MRKTCEDLMRKRLQDNPELADCLIPGFALACRRPTPGEGYLEALLKENVRYTLQPITRVTETGIVTENGEEEFDLIVAASGFDTSFQPTWNLVGRNGASLKDLWAKDATGYLGGWAVDHPNYILVMGPYSPVIQGGLQMSHDQWINYILKWCNKIAKEDIKSVRSARGLAATC